MQPVECHVWQNPPVQVGLKGWWATLVKHVGGWVVVCPFLGMPLWRELLYNYEVPKIIWINHQPTIDLTDTVDGSEIRHPPVEIGSLSHSLQGLIHPRWLFGISSINSRIYNSSLVQWCQHEWLTFEAGFTSFTTPLKWKHTVFPQNQTHQEIRSHQSSWWIISPVGPQNHEKWRF